jgi:hypothetical protein
VSGTRFVPLACDTCSGDLVGRAVDLVAFCVPCGRAYRVDGEAPLRIRVLSVDAEPPGAGPIIRLPLWLSGGVGMPAFATSRPLTLARIVSRLLTSWPGSPGPGSPPPLGTRLAPESLGDLAELARIEARRVAGAPLTLAALPVRWSERRVLVPGLEGPLYPEDVLEIQELVARAEPAALAAGS